MVKVTIPRTYFMVEGKGYGVYQGTKRIGGLRKDPVPGALPWVAIDYKGRTIERFGNVKDGAKEIAKVFRKG
jgi:hypothetical protein